MSSDAVQIEIRDAVAEVRIDDGKANALSHDVIAALQGALDHAEKDAGAVLLVGRPGRFSAGFDLSVMRESREAARGLVHAGAELLIRLFTFPHPVVAACTGHALAAGAIMLLASDTRIGAAGDFKIGLNEVAIGMRLPIFGVELARHRLSRRHFTRAVIQAEIYSPEGAVDAGFLDRVAAADGLLDVAREEAVRLAALVGPAHAGTKAYAREATVTVARDTLDRDLQSI